MAYDEHLADRITRVLHDKHIPYNEKRMMSGLCFMVTESKAFVTYTNSVCVKSTRKCAAVFQMTR